MLTVLTRENAWVQSSKFEYFGLHYSITSKYPAVTEMSAKYAPKLCLSGRAWKRKTEYSHDIALCTQLKISFWAQMGYYFCIFFIKATSALYLDSVLSFKRKSGNTVFLSPRAPPCSYYTMLFAFSVSHHCSWKQQLKLWLKIIFWTCVFSALKGTTPQEFRTTCPPLKGAILGPFSHLFILDSSGADVHN